MRKLIVAVGVFVVGFCVGFVPCAHKAMAQTALRPGDILVTDVCSATLLLLDRATGAQTVISAGGNFRNLYGVAIDPSGNIFVVDQIALGGSVFRVDPTTGTQILISAGGNFREPFGIAIERDGNLLTANAPGSTEDRIVRVDPSTGAQTIVSSGNLFIGPSRITVEAAGDILVSDDGSGGAGLVIRVNPITGAQALVSSGGNLVNPYGIAVEADGNIVVAEETGKIIRISPVSGSQTVVASGLDRLSAITVDRDGSLLVNKPGGLIRIDRVTGAQIGEYPLGGNLLCVSSIAIIPDHPPDCSRAFLSSSTCWPPNHKFRRVNVLGITDPDGDAVGVTIDGITQDEPVVGGGGSGTTCPDGVLVDDDGDGNPETAGLRCERMGTGNGRVYVVHFTARDGKGGECSGSLAFCVPHDHRPGSACVDEGQAYDSTACPIGVGAAADGGSPGVYSALEFNALTPEPLFLRGDVNFDDERDISDAVSILSGLFMEQREFTCKDAADVNDDGDLDVSDAISLLAYLFTGSTIQGPLHEIGTDLTLDDIGCE